MPPRTITPSNYVGRQVRRFRTKRGWTQQALAHRLHELGAESTGWSQTKINKLERGKLTRVLVDDVFELALALDVSPLYLLTPLEGFDEQDNALKVWLGGKVARWPREVRQWVRGVRPILGLGDYADDEAARSGQRFYLLESQPLSELRLIAEAGKEGDRIGGFVSELVDEDADGE
jgi:transcriptional regulator with XRE-family HTH domain